MPVYHEKKRAVVVRKSGMGHGAVLQKGKL
jgi:hypothetical protein